MMSPLSFLVMLLIMIIIPTILYGLFFLINCPPTPFQLRSRRSSETGDEGSKKGEKKEKETKNGDIELVVTVSSELGKDAECPVCLSAFVEGEELKQLKICKHVFHKSCIDKWLSCHCNCPLCRAFVSTHFKAKEKRDSHRLLGRDVGGRDDHWQGLPDSAGLI